MTTLQTAPVDPETVALLQEELEATNREVMLLTLELEERVARRTAELARMNQELLREIAERIRAETEVKKLNTDLARRAELLEAANQELEAFSASVSHDLRNPLAQILAFASVLEEAEALDENRRRKYLVQIGQGARRMAALIDDLLRLSRCSQVPLIKTTVHLDRLIPEVIAEIGQNTSYPNVEWVCDALPAVPGDASLLRQVFINLLNNALKFSRARNPIRIEIGLAEGHSAEELVVFVRDFGVGFDPAGAKRLFSAFQRLHSLSEFEGTGIGLLNVKRIILRHRGRVWADSRPNEGATFYVALPRNLLEEELHPGRHWPST